MTIFLELMNYLIYTILFVILLFKFELNRNYKDNFFYVSIRGVLMIICALVGASAYSAGLFQLVFTVLFGAIGVYVLRKCDFKFMKDKEEVSEVSN
jgi:uncharacterized membrane protein YfcA